MRDSEATSTPLAFIMAGVLALGSIGVVVLNTQDAGEPERHGAAEAEVLNQKSRALLRLLMESPGHDTTGKAWYVPDDDQDTGPEGGGNQDADSLRRLGLFDAQKGYLDIGKFRNLKHAPLAADNGDGYVNYPEARAQLGLADAGLDFHLRAYPTLKSIEQLLAQGVKDPNMRAVYIGHLIDDNGGSQPTVSAPVCSVSTEDGDNYRFSVVVENTGISSAVFQVEFDFDFGGNLKFDRKNQIPSLGPGASDTAWVDIERRSGITCDNTPVDVTVSDATGSFDAVPLTFPAPASHPGTVTGAFSIELDKMWYSSGDGIQVGYEGPAKNDALHWAIHQGETTAGTVVASGTESAQTGNDRVFSVPGQTAGEYLLEVHHPDTDVYAYQRVVVLAGSPGDPGSFEVSGGSVSRDPAMEPEIGMVDRLVEHFCPADYDSPTTSSLSYWGSDPPFAWHESQSPDPAYDWDSRCDGFKDPAANPDVSFTPGHHGDVFWDEKGALTEELCKRLQVVEPDGTCKTGNPARLDEINTIIVGSNVDHRDMTSGGFKWPLRDWVLAGGSLIVLGSPDGSTEWLQPIFHAGEVTSSGPLSTPDESHPLLKVPDPLEYTDYDNRGKAWRYTGDAATKFTDVVKSGTDPVTAVSNPGAYGDGTVIITTWLAYDLFGDGPGSSFDEGLKLVNNLLTISYRDLYLDYGPMLPDGAARVPAMFTGHVYHEQLNSLVEVTLVMFLFEG